MTPSFAQSDALEASFSYGFNCGPAAIAALLGLTPESIRPHLGDFESKLYMNTVDVVAALRSLGKKASVKTLGDGAFCGLLMTGLLRVQWGGSWLNPGVHPGAAARRTHWIATRVVRGARWAYDVNCPEGWQTSADWAAKTAPMLMAEVKGSNGSWHFSHSIGVIDDIAGSPF